MDISQKLCSDYNYIVDVLQVTLFLGMKVIQHEVSEDVWIGQSAYVCKVLELFGMQDAKSVVYSYRHKHQTLKAIEDDVMLVYISRLLVVYCICRWVQDPILPLLLEIYNS